MGISSVSILFVLCQLTILLRPTHGIRHQMFCESLDGTFDNELPNPIIERDEIATMIEERLSAATSVLHDRIRVLESQVEELNSTLARANEVGECDDGFVRLGICYFVIIPHPKTIPFPERNSTCIANGGRIGNVLGSEHQTLVENYLRYKIPFALTQAWIWLGMTYNHRAKTVVTSSGEEIADSEYRWYENYPRSVDGTSVLMQVSKDYSEGGIYNIPVDNSGRTKGVFCEKEV